MPVIFTTDALVFLLLFMVAVFTWYTSRHEHLRAPWRQVVKSKAAMAAAVVLLFYILVGILDSLHFHPALEGTERHGKQYSTEILSVLDVIAGHLRTETEKTYSAPLATHSFAREIMELPDGREVLDNPRLQYGGSHLLDQSRTAGADIALKTLSGMVCGGLLWLSLSALVILVLGQQRGEGNMTTMRRVLRERNGVPWHTILLTLGLLVITAATIAWLSNFYHVFGTDKVGQDVLYQSLKSVRTGLLIGTLTTLIMLPFAIALGIMAGYFRGRVDDVIQYIYTTLNSIPGVLLIAASILVLDVHMTNNAESFTSIEQRADTRLLYLCMILGIMSWTGLCRLLRGETLKLREVDYVQAAQCFGASHTAIMARHILPNVMHIVIISMVLDFSGLVLAEAVLAYINIGVDPSMASWGNMINSARLEMAREPVVWWSLATAFFAMLGLVLPANIFADAVRDAFDPRIRKLNTGSVKSEA
ncbi:MAG: ABC transporter permease [Gammaproteobacteria bacterium]